jgi:hypothetical protein
MKPTREELEDALILLLKICPEVPSNSLWYDQYTHCVRIAERVKGETNDRD